MKTWVTLALLWNLGCSSGDSTTYGGSGACGSRSGQYTVHFVEHGSTTCGPQADAIVSIDPLTVGQIASTCPSAGPPDFTSCTVQSHLVCDAPSVGTGFQTEQVATVRWSPDSSRAQGTMQLTVFNSAGVTVCAGVYDVTYQRL